jgi:hypothetical protein
MKRRLIVLLVGGSMLLAVPTGAFAGERNDCGRPGHGGRRHGHWVGHGGRVVDDAHPDHGGRFVDDARPNHGGRSCDN